MGRPWFAVKRYGYGAGLPIAWQGWALLGGFTAAAVIGAAMAARVNPALAAVPGLVLALPLVMIARAKSNADWRFRWGDEPPET